MNQFNKTDSNQFQGTCRVAILSVLLLPSFLKVIIFVELGWQVSDGDEWHHDEIWIDFGLVWRFVLTSSSFHCWLCCQQYLLSFLILGLFDVALIDRRLHDSSWPDLLMGLTWLVFRIVAIVTTPLSQIRDLTYWESNPVSKIQEEKWAHINSVWYWFIYSQTMHFVRFTTLHTNVKWHTNK